MCDRILGVNHPTTATIRENLVILQRQSTSRAIWKRRLGQFVQTLLAMSTIGYDARSPQRAVGKTRSKRSRSLLPRRGRLSVSPFYRFIYCSDRLNKS